MGKWEMVRLGEVCLKTKNVNPASYQGGISYIDVSSIDSVSKRIITYNRISPGDAPSRARRKVQYKDILVSTVRPNLNAVAVVDSGSDQLIASTAFCVLRPNPALISNKYLFEFVKAPTFVHSITRQATGANYPAVSNRIIMDEQLPLPPLNMQRKIANVLDCAGALIEKRKTQIDKLDLLIKSQFIEMFGDPVTNPKGWRKRQLGENVTLINGRAFSRHELLREGKYPILRVGNFFSNQGWYYSNLELDADKYCKNGDLLFAWSASFGARIWTSGKSIYHYHIWKIVHGEGYSRKFLCCLLNHLTRNLMRDTRGIAMMHLTKGGMEKTEIVVPPITLQNQFADFVQRVEAQKALLQRSLEKLERNYKSLQQKCFRGEIF